MKYAVWALVPLLLILRQDNWNWDDGTLIWGFMPKTLLYHAVISLAAAVTWLLATIFVWPVQESQTPAVPTTTPEDVR